MTFEELLKACANGVMPSVKIINGTIRFATGATGIITVIKQNGKHKGCAVQFEGLDYDTWFTDDPEATDKRSKYMHHLELIK